MEREKLISMVRELLNTATKKLLDTDDYKKVCEPLNVCKMYYDMELGDRSKYRNQKTNKFIFEATEWEDKFLLYDNGKPTKLKKCYTYYDRGIEHVHAYIELSEGIKEEQLDPEVYQMMADLIYLVVSCQNIKYMLQFAQLSDAQTGIPNGGPRCGDEIIVRYARLLSKWVGEDECVCRMGGDNFAMFLQEKNLQNMVEKLDHMVLTGIEAAPGRSFELPAWIGITRVSKNDPRPFVELYEEASVACYIGKRKLHRKIVEFTEEIGNQLRQGNRIISLFRPALHKHEFEPYFQAKVDMSSGQLVGFEALCRWFHKGKMIYPNEFIPVLDREGLICDLDMEIFRCTCEAIKKWGKMGLNIPRISANFSRKNLFVPKIEEKIYETLLEFELSPEKIEIEITESVQESEYNRLIEFVGKLKGYGIHIAVDDFGTGYSSLSLIHNIDADVIKIDKSFVDKIPGDRKTRILLESVIGIAQNLDMDVIAEGVETEEQGRELLGMGCKNAQGYFYSKPMNLEMATEVIQKPEFKKISIDK